MQNPFDQFDAPAAPQAPGIIQGRPKQPTIQQVNADRRAEEDQARQNRGEVRQQTDSEFTKFDKLRSDFDALQPVKTYKVAIPQYVTALKTDNTPQGDLALIYAFAKVMDPDSVVREGEAAAVSSSDTLAGQYVAQLKKQLTGTGTFSPEARVNLRKQLQTKIAELNRAYNTERGRFQDIATRFGYQPDEVIGGHFGEMFHPEIVKYMEGLEKQNAPQEQQGQGQIPSGVPADAQQVVNGPDGSPLGYYGADGEFVLLFDTPKTDASGLGDVVEGVANVASSITNPAAGAIQRAGQPPAMAERILSGATAGLSDEISGVGGALGSVLFGGDAGQGYQQSRDYVRARNEVADQRTGLTGDAVEIGSSLLLPFGAARTPMQAAKVGAIAGGIGGFGYGEGAQGSATGAGVGALVGGALGAGLGYAGNALAQRATARQISGNQSNALLQAADNVGIEPPARMFTEPSLEAHTRGVSQTIIGGQKIREGVKKFGDDIQGATQNLSSGKPIADREAAGGLVRDAGERFIEKTGKSAKAQYDRAEKLAGNAKLPASEGLKIIDELQARLGELPNENKAELAYLAGLKDDLSKNLSVGALRDLRTTLRKKISKGELTFGQNEKRVLDIMKATSADIENGLRASGNSRAAAAFKSADAKYAARMEYIEKTLQKVIGKRNSNLSNEAVFNKFKSMSRNDSVGLKKFYATLSPDEAADVSATFAQALGRGGADNAKDFSTSTLIDNIEALKGAGTSLETIFGPQGAKALKDIEALAREHKRVSGAISGGGSAAGNDWRFMLASMFLPGAGGMAASGGGTAVAAGVTGLAIKAGRDALSAKLLLSPKVTNWVRTAPKTSNPKAINAHWEKLGAIAKAEPALAAEIDAFRSAVLNAANDNAQRAVAEDGQN